MVEAEPAPAPAPEPEPAWSPEPAGGWSGEAAPADDTWGGAPATADDWAASESLDDDAFFASLREAVRDVEPLGPRDDLDDELEEDDGSRKLFRRRR